MIDDLDGELLSCLDNCALTLEEMAKVLRGSGLGGCADICDKAAERARNALRESKVATL